MAYKHKEQPAALSTGQAAKYCLVTADTIVNWIKRNNLPARRTVGGQYRILVRHLRAFMSDRGMETDILDADYDVRRYCWEHREGVTLAPIQGVTCEDCLARRVRALNCFELRAAMSHGHEEVEPCASCHYLCRWRPRIYERPEPYVAALESTTEPL